MPFFLLYELTRPEQIKNKNRFFQQLHAKVNSIIFAAQKLMEDVAQLVRASDCGSEGRGFEAPHSPFFFGFVQKFCLLITLP